VGQDRPDQGTGGRGGQAQHQLLQAELAGPAGGPDAERGEQCVGVAAFPDGRHHTDGEADARQQRGRHHDHQQPQLRRVRQRIVQQPGRHGGAAGHGGARRQPAGNPVRRPQPPLGHRGRRL